MDIAYTGDEIEEVFFMKKMMESLKEILEGLKHEIDVYLTIQRYVRISRKYKST